MRKKLGQGRIGVSLISSWPKPSLNPVQMPLLNHSFKRLNVIMEAFLYFCETQAHVRAIKKPAIESHL